MLEDSMTPQSRQRLEIVIKEQEEPKTIMINIDNPLASFLKEYTENAILKIFSTEVVSEYDQTSPSITSSDTSKYSLSENLDSLSHEDEKGEQILPQ